MIRDVGYLPRVSGDVLAHYVGAAHPIRIACSRHKAKPGEPCEGKRSVCALRDLANVRRVRAEAERAAQVGGPTP